MRHVEERGLLPPQPKCEPNLVEIGATSEPRRGKLRITPPFCIEDVPDFLRRVRLRADDDEPESGRKARKAVDQVNAVPVLTVADVQMIEAGEVEGDEG